MAEKENVSKEVREPRKIEVCEIDPVTKVCGPPEPVEEPKKKK